MLWRGEDGLDLVAVLDRQDEGATLRSDDGAGLAVETYRWHAVVDAGVEIDVGLLSDLEDLELVSDRRKSPRPGALAEYLP